MDCDCVGLVPCKFIYAQHAIGFLASISKISCTQVMFLIKDYHDRGQTLSKTALQTPTFWLVLIMTCSIILPWLRLRKVPVRAEVLSNHCVRLHFDYGK